MKVARRSVDELVVVDKGWLLRMFGAVFAGVGLLVLIVPQHPGIAADLVGSVSLLFGTLFILLPRVTTITFDRRAGTAELQRVGVLLPEERRTVQLAAIAKVEVEGHNDSDGDRLFTVSMDISGEEPMRFTTYSSSGKVDKQEVAEAVRDWLAGRSA
jgi:hypothetical protein